MSKVLVVSCALIACACGGVSASIVSVAGDSFQIAQPADAQLNQLISAPQVFVWNEAQGLTLGSNVAANAVSPGLYDAAGDLQNVLILAGTTINSHYIHFDSPASQSASAHGAVRFDGIILGVIAVNESNQRDLDNSDALGAPTLFTHNNNNRGLEFNTDDFRITADGMGVEFNFRITAPGDYMRVITATPTPGATLLLGASGLIALRRRR